MFPKAWYQNFIDIWNGEAYGANSLVYFALSALLYFLCGI
jgi:hypothetical protein